MKTASAGFQTHIAGEVLTLCRLVKLTTRYNDGTVNEVMGFTDHDQDIEFEDVTYEAETSVLATALRSTLDTGVDNMDVGGILTSDRVTETDLLAGVYDGADFELMEVNWADLTQGAITHVAGSLGNISLTEGRFVVGVRSRMQRVAQQIGEIVSATCIVKRLGDEDCLPPGAPGNGFVLADVRFARTVYAVSADYLTITFDSDVHASGVYSQGIVKMTSGPNINIEREIKSHTISSGRAVLVLQEAFPYAVTVGETGRLEWGCDRSTGVCKQTFDNLVNYRGFPDVPGAEKILQRGRK
jgi:uncharacterized phage protein (TIGR02218 family)